MKLEKADEAVASSSASSWATFKEDMPGKMKIATADIFKNEKKMPFTERNGMDFADRSTETSEDDTLMGRLAKRMASRDYIDKQNLGMGTKAQKASVADGSASNAQKASFADDAPSKMNMSGPALKKGMKVESEHTDTIENIKDNNLNTKEATAAIAKDHLSEDPKYYDKLQQVESKKNNLMGIGKDFQSTELGKSKDYALANIEQWKHPEVITTKQEKQVEELQGYNNSDPASNLQEKPLLGKNMYEQAKLRGNVFGEDYSVK